jgi:hypothetical protein
MQIDTSSFPPLGIHRGDFFCPCVQGIPLRLNGQTCGVVDSLNVLGTFAVEVKAFKRSAVGNLLM